MSYRLLTEFAGLFKGKRYLHRDSSRGDFVAMHLYEDLYNIGKSEKLCKHVDSTEWVLSQANKALGIKARRGDGTFGELVPGETAIFDAGYEVGRGIVATIEIGVEVKIIAKAMIKQIDRVTGDLQKQVANFAERSGARPPIAIAIVGINQAEYAVGYEGEKEPTKTDGKKHKHPFQEAKEAERRLVDAEQKKRHYEEIIFLRYSATNDEPYAFSWQNQHETEQQYGAALLRICREYEKRF
jgi:hypothetical protein